MRPTEIASLKTDRVLLKAKTSTPEIRLTTTKIDPIVAGSEVELERWQAEVLIEWGILERPADSTSLLSRAYKDRDRELSGRTLERIDDPFHTLPGIVEAFGEEGLLDQKKGVVRALFEDLISSRTNKIARNARMGQDPGEGLSPEEAWLYWSLREVFDVWRRETNLLLEPPE